MEEGTSRRERKAEAVRRAHARTRLATRALQVARVTRARENPGEMPFL